jgi:hypothetical protein
MLMPTLRRIAPRGDAVSKMTHQAETLFAIEVEPSGQDLSQNLLVYRRLTAKQKVAVAAELKLKVELEIAQAKRPSRRRLWRGKRANTILRVKTGLLRIKDVLFSCRQYLLADRIVHAVHLSDDDFKRRTLA